MGPQIFNVVTEFRFDIAHAVASSETLQKAVGGISGAADRALGSIRTLGAGVFNNMGLGILGVLGAAIQASDKFGQSQRQLANIFLSNNMFTGADGFQKAMEAAAVSMSSMQKKAQEFSLPSSDLVQFTKIIGASLISHGLDDSSMKKSMDLSRGFLKSAPTLGIDPQLAQGQLLDAVMGRASLGDTLFQRLMNETTAMHPFKGNTKAFNSLGDEKRVQVLTDALLQFGSNAQILAGNAQSLTGELQRLKDSFIGMFSILRPIGDAILKGFLPAFHVLNDFLAKQGAQLGKTVAKMIEGIVADPQALLTNLMQARRLQADVNRAGSVMGFLGMIAAVSEVLKLLGLRAQAISGSLAAASWLFRMLGQGILTGLSYAFRGVISFFSGGIVFTIANGLVTLLSRIFIPLGLLIGFFQLISRSLAIARIDDAKAILASSGDFAKALARLKSTFGILFEPFASLFDYLARGIAPLFRFSYYFDALIWVMERAADAMVLFLAGFQGVVFAIMQMVENVKGMFTGQGFDMTRGVGDAFNAGIDQMIAQAMGKIDSGEGVVTAVTNIGKVEIQNSFKEQMEPDRIAFALKEQLLKTAMNPQEATGRTFRSALAGG